jgi:hypothetical protein
MLLHLCDIGCDSVCDCAHEDQSDNQGTRQLPQVMRACGSVTSVRSTTKHTHARAVHGPREASASHDCMCSQRTHSRASHDCKDSKDDACELAGMLQDCMQALIDITERERAPEQSSSLSLPPPPLLSPPPLASTLQERTILSLRAELARKEDGRKHLQEQLDQTETQLQTTQKHLEISRRELVKDETETRRRNTRRRRGRRCCAPRAIPHIISCTLSTRYVVGSDCVVVV